MMHLWEPQHDYYCNEHNYHAGPSGQTYEYATWEQFITEFGDADMDYNLLFRWDWLDAVTTDGEPIPGRRDLFMFWLAQRKGIYRATIVRDLGPEYENQIRAFLQPRLDHLIKLWAPLTPTVQP